MAKGHPTPKEKLEQAVALADTSMTQKSIAETIGISQRQVSRIWQKAGIRRRDPKPSVAASGAGPWAVGADVLRHQAPLLSVLQNLEDVDVFKSEIYDMNRLLSDPESKCSIEKGQLIRDNAGRFSIELWAEKQVEWVYLQEHLDGKPFGGYYRSGNQSLSGT